MLLPVHSDPSLVSVVLHDAPGAAADPNPDPKPKPEPKPKREPKPEPKPEPTPKLKPNPKPKPKPKLKPNQARWRARWGSSTCAVQTDGRRSARMATRSLPCWAVRCSTG